MEILMLTWEYPPNKVGGVAAHVEDLSKTLNEMGHDITVITFGEEEESEVKDGIEVHRINAKEGPDITSWVLMSNHRMQKKGVELLKEKDFDIIHAHDWSAVPAAASLKEVTDAPMVTTLHSLERSRVGSIHSDMSKLINDLEWYGAYEADKVITVGEDIRDEILHHFSVPEEKLHHVPNGVFADKFQKGNSVRDEIALDWEIPVLFVGRLCHQKGVRHLIEAMPKVLDKKPEVKFIVAGGGGGVDHYRNMAESIGVDDKAYFPGFVPDDQLIDLYNSVDATVMPSVYEPFGIVALESMSAGTPVVGSHVGGIKQTVVHEWTGLHVEPANPDSIAWGIEKAISDPTWNDWMGKNGKKRAEEKFTWHRVADMTLDVYDKAIKTK